MNDIFIAKTIEEAKLQAVKAFNTDENRISFEILEEPKKGLFGKLKGEARIKAEFIPTKSEVARDYIKGILDIMNINSASTMEEIENGAIINFDGDGTGTIIGRRGETLDALQYLASMACNKGDKEYFRITLNSCGYREKRKATLEDLAHKISKSVSKTGRSTALEPMNPYERRIIHSAVADVEGVTSRSVGEEPYRKVIISSTVKKTERSKRDDNKGVKKNGAYHKNNARKPESRSLDLKTSFEKEYKKPKPEDNIKAGLYGKIEF